MKKSAPRLIAIGVAIVLGAFAIVLAQHDARNRDREQPDVTALQSQPAVPLAVEGDWETRGGALVRANNDPLPELPFEQTEEDVGNPLRGVAKKPAPSFLDGPAGAAEVVPASGERPAEEAPYTPPAWLTNAAASLPAMPDEANSAAGSPTGPVAAAEPAAAIPSLPTLPTAAAPATAAEGSESQTLPTFPIGAGVSGRDANAPALPSGTPPNLGGIPGAGGGPLPTATGTDRASATPRGAMQATDLSPPRAATPSSPPAGPPASTNSALPGGNPLPAGSSTPPAGYPIGPAQGRSFAAGGASEAAAADFNQSRVNSPRAVSSLPPNSLAALVSNQPGNRYLDGSQNPILMIHKRAPEEIQVGKKATFVITVRNAGNAVAHDVTVVDSVPRGSSFVSAAPEVAPNAEGLLTWKLGEMAAGDERTISLQIIPEVQGEVGSVASVHFAARASVRTVATLPKLEVLLESQSEVLIGDAQSVNVVLKNTGTGVARNVRLEADIPSQLRHESGESLLDAGIGDMRPNEVKRLELICTAAQPGQAQLKVRAVTDDGLQAEQALPVDVRAPQLVASIEGPSLRYLDRQATYRIQVKNSGTAAASNLDFVIHLPAGLRFISTDVPQSTYDPNNNTVSLGLYELAAGQTAPVALTVLPVELGPQVIKFNATADLGATAEARGQVLVDGLAELAFTIGQDNGTIETGASSTYSVQITNVGNKPDKDVQLVVQLPKGTELLAVDAPVEYRVDGDKLLFAPVAEMPNNDQKTYRFEVRHNQAGNQVVRTQLTSANWPVAVVKEEGTLVYNDRN